MPLSTTTPKVRYMGATFKKHTKKALNDAVSLVNAPRRTASYNVPGAWDALTAASSPKELLGSKALLEARVEVNAEVERCTHAAPKFSADGKVAVLEVGRRGDTLKKARREPAKQANTLLNYFCKD